MICPLLGFVNGYEALVDESFYIGKRFFGNIISYRLSLGVRYFRLSVTCTKV